jgi:hypothetical protein
VVEVLPEQRSTSKFHVATLAEADSDHIICSARNFARNAVSGLRYIVQAHYKLKFHQLAVKSTEFFSTRGCALKA